MMHLLAIPNMIGAHPGGWRHPTAYDDPVMNLPRMIDYARLAEHGRLDGLFLADGNGIRDMDEPALFAANFPSARPGVFDPVVLMTALAGHAERIGLVSTATTTFDEPFHAFDLAVGPRVVHLGQPVLDAVLGVCAVEDVLAVVDIAGAWVN